MLEARHFLELPPTCQEIIHLSSQGLRKVEIAVATGLELGAVERQTSKLLRELDLTGHRLAYVVSLACQANYFSEPLDIDEPSRPLSGVELLAVQRLADGLTAKTDSIERGITVRAIEKQRLRAQKKLGALTLPHLVRCCFQLGYLQPTVTSPDAQEASGDVL